VVDDHLPAAGPLDPDAMAARAADAGGDGDLDLFLGLLKPAFGDPLGVRDVEAIIDASAAAARRVEDVDLPRWAMVLTTGRDKI